jgi:hypothetical protein
MRFSFAQVLASIAILLTLIWIFVPAYDHLKYGPESKEPKPTANVVELTLPEDFNEMISASYSHGHIYMTYKDRHDGHRTYAYGYFGSFPEKINWVESKINKERAER